MTSDAATRLGLRADADVNKWCFPWKINIDQQEKKKRKKEVWL